MFLKEIDDELKFGGVAGWKGAEGRNRRKKVHSKRIFLTINILLTRAGSSQITLVGSMTWQVASIPVMSSIGVQFSSVAQSCPTL